MLLGAVPDAPNTDYGWITCATNSDCTTAPDEVTGFVEKPGGDRAAALLRSGRALWNTMILVCRPRTLLDLFERRLGALVERLETLIARQAGRIPIDEYRTLPYSNFSIDVLQGAEGLSVLALPRAVGILERLQVPPRLGEHLVDLRDRPRAHDVGEHERHEEESHRDGDERLLRLERLLLEDLLREEVDLAHPLVAALDPEPERDRERREVLLQELDLVAASRRRGFSRRASRHFHGSSDTPETWSRISRRRLSARM